MKFFTNKKFLFKLIISVCLCLTLLQFYMSIVVQAMTETSLLTDVEEKIEVTSTPAVINHSEADPLAWGGQILQPIIDLVMSLGDGIMNLIQGSIMGGLDAYIPIDKARHWWLTILAIVLVAILAIFLFVVAWGAIATVAAAAGTWLSSAAAAGGIAGLAAKGMLGIGGVALAAAKGFTIVLTIGVGTATALTAVSAVDEACFPEVTILPLYTISPQELFRGDILLFDVNIFNPKEVLSSNGARQTYRINGDDVTTDEDVYYYENEEGELIVTSKQSSAYELKTIVSKWYYTFRNIAIVVLMVILVYVGIRMLISSAASDKAKYKQMILDWGIALCLVFVIHYIMIFAINLTESIVQMLKSASEITTYSDVIDFRNSSHIKDYEDAITAGGLDPNKFIRDKYDENNAQEPSIKKLIWPTNLMGHVRILAQQQDGTASYVGYALCYIVLVMFTCYFTFAYAKRLLYITFLTVIAPLVAITYPIDKINDGKAQAFDIWFKEYIFNLLIQPLHLMLYTLLISMAFELAGSNVVYSLVATGFMIPAEKFLRKMFNFEKAQTPGFLSGAGGAALLMSGLNTLSRIGGKSKGKDKEGGNASEADRNRLNNRGFDSGLSFDNVMGGAQGENALPNTSNSNLQENLLDDERNSLADMLDVDGESIGSTEWNAQEFAANAADLHRNEFADENTPGMPQNIDEARAWGEELGYEGDELDQFLIDQGFGEEEIDGEEALIDDNQEESLDVEDLEDETPRENKNKFDFSKAARSVAQIGFEDAVDNIPDILDTSLQVLGGAAGFVIGTGGAIASGNPENMIKYPTAGAAATKALVGKRPSTHLKRAKKEREERKEKFEKAYYGTEYGKHKKEEADMMFKKDNEIRQKYAEELGINKKYKEEMRRAKEISDLKERREKVAEIKKQRKTEIDKTMDKATEYRKFNVTNDDVIIKAMKIDKDKRNNNIASRDKIASAMIATRAKTSKDIESHIERLRKQGVSQNDANRIARNAREINKDIV